MPGDHYETEYEMIIDFLKLSVIIEIPELPMAEKREALQIMSMFLQPNILPTSTNTRIQKIHDLMHKLYDIATKSITDDNSDTEIDDDEMHDLAVNDCSGIDKYIILVYDDIDKNNVHLQNKWKLLTEKIKKNNDYKMLSYSSKNMPEKLRAIFAHVNIAIDDNVPGLYNFEIIHDLNRINITELHDQ